MLYFHNRDLELNFYRDHEQREVDFVITEARKPIILVECKATEKTVSKDLRYLKEKFPKSSAFQVSNATQSDYLDGKSGIRVGPFHQLAWEILELLK